MFSAFKSRCTTCFSCCNSQLRHVTSYFCHRYTLSQRYRTLHNFIQVHLADRTSGYVVCAGMAPGITVIILRAGSRQTCLGPGQKIMSTGSDWKILREFWLQSIVISSQALYENHVKYCNVNLIWTPSGLLCRLSSLMPVQVVPKY